MPFTENVGATRGIRGTMASIRRAPAVQVDSRVKPENDINFKAQCPSQTPPEQSSPAMT